LGAFWIIGPIGVEEVIPNYPAGAVWEVYFEGTEGSADDDNINGLDEVETEMTSLQLTGNSPFMGVVELGLNPFIPSLGGIEENVNTTPDWLDVAPFTAGGTASVYLGIYFEVTILGLTYYTVEPMDFYAQISHKPPASLSLYSPSPLTQLYDANGNQAPWFLTFDINLI
jgi:hypothetical protein